MTGDPTKRHTVLPGSCVNARDAIPVGRRRTLPAVSTTTDAHFANVNLHTTPGCFDRFFTTKEVGRGTGVGMFTSMAIVESYGGFVRAYSEMGRDLNLNLCIPARIAATNEVGVRTTELTRGRGESMLILDHESAARLIAQRRIEALRYRAVVAVHGAVEAAVYARCSDERVAVLTGLIMPMIDGPRTIRVLREKTPDVCIIAASALSANAHGAGPGLSHF